MACLCDFGLSRVVGELPVYPSTNMLGTPRWTAPELYCFEDGVPQPQITNKCDIYSYGCIIHEVCLHSIGWSKHPVDKFFDIAVQVISTYMPYYNIKSEARIILMKASPVAPERPPTAALLTDDVWDFIQLCWRDYPPWRPDAEEVREKLKELVQQYSKEELLATLPAELEYEAGLELD
jgi:serine/threonine protein kinase